MWAVFRRGFRNGRDLTDTGAGIQTGNIVPSRNTRAYANTVSTKQAALSGFKT